eukprot:COSAG01_NODE_7164_length_3323_cov_4.681452_2_plen_68_part_00
MRREPLNGDDITLPIRGDVKHAISGYRQVVESLLTLHEASQVCCRAACRWCCLRTTYAYKPYEWGRR